MSLTNKEIIPFTLDHLKDFDADKLKRIPNYKTRFEHAIENGTACSGVVDGKVLFLGGVVIQWPGVGEAWVLLADGASKYPLFLTKACLTVLSRAVKKHSLHRLQATVRVGFDEAEEWIKHLGFVCEGRMTKYSTNAEDHLMFGRVET